MFKTPLSPISLSNRRQMAEWLGSVMPALLAKYGVPANADLFFVDSDLGRDNTSVTGQSWLSAYKTPTYALVQIARRANGKPSFIFWAPGGSLSLTAASAAGVGVHMDRAYTHLIGLGSEWGAAPILQFGTVAGADANIGATGCSIREVDFKAHTVTAATVTTPLDILAAGLDFSLVDCRMLLTATGTAPTAWLARHASATGFKMRGNIIQDAIVPSYSRASLPSARHNITATPITFAAGTTGAVAAGGKETITVTGNIGYDREWTTLTDLTSGGSAVISLGREGAVAELIAATDFDLLNAGVIWFDETAPAIGALASELAPLRGNYSNGADLGYAVTAATVTGGTALDAAIWHQRSDGAFAIPGALGAL